MPTTASSGRVFGSSVKRREDPRLITGRGRFTDDITLPGTLHVTFVRSPHAHARIRKIDMEAALAHPDVVEVYTGRDLAEDGVKPIPTAWLLPDLKLGERRVIAVDRVRYMGEAVAMVIAANPFAARDAAELVEVDYDPLPAVTGVDAALREDAPQLYDDAPNNIAFEWSLGEADATEAAFRKAAVVVRQRLINNRLSPHAIEPRACLANYDPATDELTLWVTSQNPHVHRLIIGAFVLGIPEHRFRVISPDVGGGFGSKIHVYSEEIAVSWASKRLGRPVRWTAQRSESFLTDSHGRDHVTDAEMAFDEDGHVLGLRIRSRANLGANLSLFGVVTPTYLFGPVASGSYRIPAIRVEVTGVFTNTTPVDALRGAGRPEACYIVERLMDLGAKRFNEDPAAFRRKNFIPADAFPYQTPVAVVYDSGNYAPALDRALEMVDYRGFREEQERLRRQGRYLGIGLSCYIEACGLAPSRLVGKLGAQAGLFESGQIRVHPTGKVTVFTGSHSHGQGHETTFAQIVADELGVAFDDVEVEHGDTAQIPYGMGTYGSRSAAVGGTALYMAACKIRDKARKIAAHLLEAAEEDIEIDGGRYFVRGSPDRMRTFGDLALAAHLAHDLPEGMEPGLEATSFFDPDNFVFPFGTHIAVVEVAADTGEVKLLRYVSIDDVGNVINPMIVDGQLHGGIAHGVGQALWEEVVYDENGQLLTGSLMEYALPRADQLPFFEMERTVTPSPVNPLGVKGVGEAGAIAAPPAVVNAVMDALAPFGVDHIDMPLTPAKVWQAMRGGHGR